MFLHGARHDPDSPSLADATPYRVGARTATSIDWFAIANCPADADILGNDILSCCCEVADYRLVQLWRAFRGEMWKPTLDLVKTRYEAVAAWNGIVPGNDPGSIPQADCAAWQATAIRDDEGNAYPARWRTVEPADMTLALQEGPLLGTIKMTAANADDPELWLHRDDGPAIDFHRVVVGAYKTGLFVSRSYGVDYYVHPSLFVAADFMERV